MKQLTSAKLTKFLEKNELEITLVVFGSESVSISGRLMDEVSSFIDDRYVQEALVKEYKEELFSIILNGAGLNLILKLLASKAALLSASLLAFFSALL